MHTNLEARLEAVLHEDAGGGLEGRGGGRGVEEQAVHCGPVVRGAASGKKGIHRS